MARGVVRGVARVVVFVVVDGSADEDGAGSVSDGDGEGVLDTVGVGVCGAGSDAVAGAVDGVAVSDELLLGWVVTWSPSSASDHDVEAEGVGVGSVTAAVGARLVRIPKTPPPTSIGVPAITRPRGVSCTTCSPDGLARPTASRPMRSPR